MSTRRNTEKRTKAYPPMETANHTGRPFDEITALEVVGRCENRWRRRWVTLYRLEPGRVISMGIAFDGSLMVLAEESDTDHCNTLASFPKTYVYH